MRQALGFGLAAAFVGLAALSWPLLLTLLVGNLAFTLAVYAAAMAADAVLFVWWLWAALRYARRASRGESFEIPVIGALTRRVFAKP